MPLTKRQKEQKSSSSSSKLDPSKNNHEPDEIPDEEKSNTRGKRGSIFGLKFGTSNNNVSSSIGHSSIIHEKKHGSNYTVAAKDCSELDLDQRIRIQNSPDIQSLQLFVTKPQILQPLPPIPQSQTQAPPPSSSSTLSTNIFKKSFLLSVPTTLNDDENESSNTTNNSSNNTNAATTEEVEVMNPLAPSVVVVGIPYPEPFLTNPINLYSPHPTSEHRKRSALINGPLINLDTSLKAPVSQTEDLALLYALKEIFECMTENRSQIGVVSPLHFITKLKEKNFLFRQTNMHQDAHEFFNYLLNEIIECLDSELGPKNNWCNKIFQGVITNETKCLSCETITSRDEKFLDLSVDVPRGNSSYSLNYCLNNFSKIETLRSQNKFYCNTCSSLQEATKTIKLKSLPETLVINFKRFKYNEELDKMVKLFDPISYPFKLRVFNTTDCDSDEEDNVEDEGFVLYDLYALVIHIGGGPMHGHYVAICKIKAGLWLLYDDETVELVEESYVMRFFGSGPGLASAYILFYSKTCEQDHQADLSNDGVHLGFDIANLYHGEDYTLNVNNKRRTSEMSSTPSHSTTATAKTKHSIFGRHQEDENNSSFTTTTTATTTTTTSTTTNKKDNLLSPPAIASSPTSKPEEDSTFTFSSDISSLDTGRHSSTSNNSNNILLNNTNNPSTTTTTNYNNNNINNNDKTQSDLMRRTSMIFKKSFRVDSIKEDTGKESTLNKTTSRASSTILHTINSSNTPAKKKWLSRSSTIKSEQTSASKNSSTVASGTGSNATTPVKSEKRSIFGFKKKR
ncbi:uncharacterized protein KQ657_002718 [Scheffersomyces spartinae]|uniref:ubiquitinyl hydrolase 1 n=1 Tax=Scheffersomyces spartinae TaxID=45513 RepID=A0A9P7V5V6_9ASCO|nr:uncharacterized protein KQ657_002718 [Scheffersomyces spartinae]KAG7191928.1 hypothetical protein KQ657_002718 [Scheffersomyces spartinae]